MKKIDNCIQLKIDQLIKKIIPKNDENDDESEDVNEVTSLISFSLCLDLFDFLNIYSKIQKNELLFHMAVIYEILGYYQLSLEYIEESLIVIPNVPTIILFKSGLYAAMNRLDEAQKNLLKYKYLIGEDIYYNYIYNSIRILYFYLLDYEANIILREINYIESKFQKYYNNNVIIFYIKSKIFHKLSEKFKRIDIKRSNLYEKESTKNKEKVFSDKKIDAEYLYKKDINTQNIMKLLSLVYPYFIEYRPKPLIDYNQNFHSGFGLFYTLIKICKICKFRIQIIKYKKNNKNKFEKKDNKNSKKNLINDNNLDYILNIIKNDNTNMNSHNFNIIRECQESILSMCKSVWITNYISNSSNINKKSSSSLLSIKKNKYYKNNNNDNKMTNDSKNNNINDKIKTNYYIYNGYYSNLNLKESIIKNIYFNNEYKERVLGKDSLLDEINEDFQKNIKINKSNDDLRLKKNNSFFEDNEMKIFNNKLIKKKNNEKHVKSHYNIKLVKSTQNNHKINKNNNKIIKVKINIDNTNFLDDKNKKNNINKEKVKEKQIIKKNNNNINYFDNIKSSKNSFINKNSKNINNNKNYTASNKYITNSNNVNFKNTGKNYKDHVINNYSGKYKKEKKKPNENIKIKDSKKIIIKNEKNTNSVNNIFNNIIIVGTNDLYLSKNNTKLFINDNNKKEKTSEKKNKNSIINDSNKSKELTIVKELEKNQETNNDINNNIDNIDIYNKVKNDNNLEKNNKLYIYQINNLNNLNYESQSSKDKNINIGQNGKINDIEKYFIKKIENSKKNKKAKIIEKINQSEKVDNKTQKNFDKIVVSSKSSLNQSIKNHNINKNTRKYLEKTINKKELTLEKSPYNTISLKEYSKSNKNNNKKQINYIKYKNINKILNNNIHNKIQTYLEYKPKKNSKNKNKKKCQLSIQEKANYLTINIDLISKSKVCTPTYKKISIFDSLSSDSKDKKNKKIRKIGLSKLNINSPTYINLKKGKLINISHFSPSFAHN